MRRPAALVVAILAVAAVGACGRKGSPVAPERRLPQAPAELTAVVGPGEVALSWRNPRRRVDGSRLHDLVGLRVYRTVDGREGEPKPALAAGDRVVGYGELASIGLDRPEPAQVEADRVRFADRTELTEGRRYTYVVTAVDSTDRMSPPSPRASVVFIAAPLPPRDLAGRAGEQQVELSWQPPAGLVDGRAVAGTVSYRVLRATAPGAAPTVVTPSLITETRYADRGLRNEQTYYYSVLAVRADQGGVATSGTVTPIAVTPHDVTPPAPPVGVMAIPAGSTVHLAWEASPEPDLAGYVVYRAPGDGTPVPVGTVTAPATTFVDRSLSSGTYRYAVSAFDSAPRRNESARSSEVGVTVP